MSTTKICLSRVIRKTNPEGNIHLYFILPINAKIVGNFLEIEIGGLMEVGKTWFGDENFESTIVDFVDEKTQNHSKDQEFFHPLYNSDIKIQPLGKHFEDKSPGISRRQRRMNAIFNWLDKIHTRFFRWLFG